MSSATPLELVLKRDRVVVVSGLLGVSALAWAYTFYVAQDMGNMNMATAQMASWTAANFLLMYTMWAVMMVAMMVPTAAPMVLIFAAVNRRRREQHVPFVSTWVFLLGYVVVWSAFAAAAILAQWGLHSASLLSPMMETSNNVLGGVILLAAGAFQWSPIKYACLTNCRSPLGFIMSEWREGTGGALSMGLHQGLFCLGCC